MSTIGEVMSTDLLTVEEDATLVATAAAMDARRVGAVLVLREGRLVGILTERDVLRAAATGDLAGTVVEWMTPHPETVEAGETAQQAGVIMIHGGFRHLPVLDGATPVGIVSIRDLMRNVLEDVSPRGV
jgi:CBS domain-containing protein